MAKRSNAGERLTAIETEMPHVWAHLESSRQAVDRLATEIAAIRATLSKYAQTGLLLATAGLFHSVSPGSSAVTAELLKVAFKLFVS